jgi:hypothetical protein
MPSRPTPSVFPTARVVWPSLKLTSENRTVTTSKDSVKILPRRSVDTTCGHHWGVGGKYLSPLEIHETSGRTGGRRARCARVTEVWRGGGGWGGKCVCSPRSQWPARLLKLCRAPFAACNTLKHATCHVSHNALTPHPGNPPPHRTRTRNRATS